MTTRIAITGGAGFIGQRLIRRLQQQIAGASISVYDNLHSQIHGANASNPLPPEVNFCRGAVEDASKLQPWIRHIRPDIVYHLAAETGTGQSYDLVSRYCQVNVTGTAHVLEAIRVTAPDARVVLAGSRAVYGEGAYVDATTQELRRAVTRSNERMHAGDFRVRDAQDQVLMPMATKEDLPPRPVSVYASTKLMQEYLLQQVVGDATANTTILRFQNVYGPGQSLRNPYTGVLSIFCSQILAGQQLNIFEDGEIVRDFVYVDDVVEALVLAGIRAQAAPGPINIGSGRPATIRDVAIILLRELGADPSCYRISGQFRSGDIRYACADISLAQHQLNWQSRIALEEGLSRLAAWAKAATVG